MDIRLHKRASKTPKIRAEIQAAPAHITDTALAERFGVSDMTIRRWRHRDDVYDRPHTLHSLKATLNHAKEEVLIAAREFLCLGLDDLLVVAREFLHPTLSRTTLHRMLKRRQVPTLAQLAKRDQESKKKTLSPFETTNRATSISISSIYRRYAAPLSVRCHRPCYALGLSGAALQPGDKRC